MKKDPLLFFLLGALFFGVGLFSYLNKDKMNLSMMEEKEEMPKAAVKEFDVMEEVETTVEVDEMEKVQEVEEKEEISGSGDYLVYSPETLSASAAKRRVIFFYANWCSTCKPVDLELQENLEKLPEDLVVLRANFNDKETDANEEALAKKYGVTYQHTFVQIDENGEAVTKWSGGQLDELLKRIK